MPATLTIFTPAYNRAHLLPRLYESLCRQSCHDFCWLIIDDGSTDNTRELVQGWIAEQRLPIRYEYKPNGGMHTAHNLAYRLINTELNTCIDSDDYMPDDAVEKIIKCWKEHRGEGIAGIIGLDSDTNGKILGEAFSHPFGITPRGRCKLKGDKKLILRTDVVRKYPEYPVFEGEKYFGLGYLYMLIHFDWSFVTTNDVYCIVEYQNEGSSKNMLRQYLLNPNGFAELRILTLSHPDLSILDKMRLSIHYVSSCFLAKKIKGFLSRTPCPFYAAVALVPGYLLSLYIKHNANNK